MSSGVYVFTAAPEDNRQWIGGIIRSANVQPTDNLHNHPVESCLTHKLPSIVASDISKTCSREGSTLTSKQYKQLGRPYMRHYSISSSSTYQFIMSPLTSKLLSEAEFVETDTTYNENSELM